MATIFWLLVIAAIVISAFGWLALGAARRRRSEREVESASRAFDAHRVTLAAAFRDAAQATGKPRGLRWLRCELAAEAPLLARDAATGELLALARMTVAFEAIEGGDMEEVDAVGDLRDATAVFYWRRGRWESEGRAVFNHGPEQTLSRFASDVIAI